MNRLQRYQRRVKRKLPRSQPTDGVGSRMRRKGGPLDEPSDEWRSEALAEMKRRGLSKTALAAALKVNKSSITVLFRLSTAKPPGPVTSTLARPVAEFLQVPLASQITPDEARILRHLRELKKHSLREFKRAIALIEAIAGADDVSDETK